MFTYDEYTPLYIQFYKYLKEELKNYPIGSNIPPERALCEIYNIDRVTVRKALAIMSEEGYIKRKQGCGTQVLRHEKRPIDNVLFLLCQSAHMVDRLGEPFYACSLDLLEEELRKINKRLLYSKVLASDNLSALCKKLDAQAVILAGTPDEAILKQCMTLHLPLIGYNTRIADFSSVMVDNDFAAECAARHLLSLGHKRIGFFHVSGHINSEKRLSRFQIEMRNAGIDASNLIIAESKDWSEESGYELAMKMLDSQTQRVTAIFGGNDSMAIGALRAVHNLNLRVPEDVSLIGFDGIAQSKLTNPPLTTLCTNMRVMAEATCMLLNHTMNFGISGSMNIIAATEFLIRGSTSAPCLI